jgi:nucleoside-diphosphate-sugar epimerase
MEPTTLPTSGWAKDSVEVESYVRGLARRRPDLTVTTLRFANFLGPTANTPMAQYFSLPVIPTVLGYDARLQFVHEDDGLEVLRRATVEDHPGIYNVAGDGVLALEQLGFAPDYTTERAFEEFISVRRADVEKAHRLVADVERALVSSVTRGRAHVAS